mgnify:CR=1 FL=1
MDKEKTSRAFKIRKQRRQISILNLATAHNLRFIIRLTEEIHQAILEERFEEYKNKFLKDFYRQ